MHKEIFRSRGREGSLGLIIFHRRDEAQRGRPRARLEGSMYDSGLWLGGALCEHQVDSGRREGMEGWDTTKARANV